jgi:photosystem II stability/assembly factor-like uncharacterized protein
MNLKRCMLTAAVVAGCALGTAVPAGAAVSAGATSHLLPMSTSWPTPRQGIVLGYPSRTPGARPVLLVTGDGGHSWRRLPAPPVPFPVNNNQPDATWAGGVIAVTDGTHVVATRDAGRHWYRVRLAGVAASASFFAGHITIADGRMLTLVTVNGANGTAMTTVFAGPAGGSTLRAVRGLSVSGGITYGSISGVGALQVSLGSDFTSARYWFSRNGVRFVSAPLACPAQTAALLGGVRDGKPTALCSGSPSDAGPGQNDKQVWIAPRLGGKFSPSGPVFVSPNAQGFAAASDRDMTIASAFFLSVTFDAGQTWTTKVPQANGGFWADLAFASRTTGTVVVNTVDDSGNQVGTVYRTTDAGRSWHALPLP